MKIAVASDMDTPLARAVVDPGTNAVHTWLLRGPRKLAPHLRQERDALAQRAIDAGPDGLTAAEQEHHLDYLSLMRRNLAAMRKALACR